jgi:hypothetical protein
VQQSLFASDSLKPMVPLARGRGFRRVLDKRAGSKLIRWVNTALLGSIDEKSLTGFESVEHRFAGCVWADRLRSVGVEKT